EIVNVHIARAQELGVLEMVEFEVGQAVAHVVFATEKLLLPDHLAVALDAAHAGQVTRQFADAQFRAVGAITQLGMRQVQVVATLHDVVGELVAQCVAQAVRLAVVADDVETGQFGFFTRVFSKCRDREVRTRPHHNAAVAFVEPFRLRTDLTLRRFAAFDAPLEDLHGVGHARFDLTVVLVHLVPRRGAAQVREARA
nr:hypothetical protein [Tanacetum cinerariifolium]